MDHLREDIIELLRFGIALLCAAALLFVTKIGCPVRFLTGICCPGCGISRAMISLLQGDIQKAAYYHPLFWVPFIMLILWLCRRHFSETQTRAFLIAMILLYLAVYLVRLASGSNVVVYQPENGMIYRTIRYVMKIMS